MVGEPQHSAGVSRGTEEAARDLPLPGGSFRLLVQKLAYQALMSLGTIENPVTQAREANLPQARTVIDDLLMLEEKTAGNLDADEAEYLRGVIAELEKNHSNQVRESDT